MSAAMAEPLAWIAPWRAVLLTAERGGVAAGEALQLLGEAIDGGEIEPGWPDGRPSLPRSDEIDWRAGLLRRRLRLQMRGLAEERETPAYSEHQRVWPFRLRRAEVEALIAERCGEPRPAQNDRIRGGAAIERRTAPNEDGALARPARRGGAGSDPNKIARRTIRRASDPRRRDPEEAARRRRRRGPFRFPEKENLISETVRPDLPADTAQGETGMLQHLPPAARPGDPHNRCSLLACAAGAAAALAEAAHDGLRRRSTPALGRQAEAFEALAGLLDHMTMLADRRVDAASFRDLWRLLTRRLRQADALTGRGAPLEELLPLAGPKPAGRLPVTLWGLGWISAARLAEALDGIVATRPSPGRLDQAKALGALETALRHVLAARTQHTAARKAAISAALAAFERADAAIGGDVAAIFAEEEGCRPRPGLAA